MRRLAMIALSLSMMIALSAAGRTAYQDEKAVVKDTPKKDDAKTAVKTTDIVKTADTAKAAAPVAIPKDVEEKLEAARKAVAELIASAEAAGLVQTSIEPPPILDILATGRATDETALADKKGVSPEVFGAWFAKQGKPGMKIVPQTDVRIFQPSQGLSALYEQRASVLNKYLDEARKKNVKPKPEATKDETPKAETKKAETPKEATKKDETPKAETKKDDAPKAETKKEEPKKDEAPKAETKKDETPKAETKKDEAPKADTPKEEAKKDETKKDEAPKADRK